MYKFTENGRVEEAVFPMSCPCPHSWSLVSLLSNIGGGLLKSGAPWKPGVSFPELRNGWLELCLGTAHSVQLKSPDGLSVHRRMSTCKTAWMLSSKTL